MANLAGKVRKFQGRRAMATRQRVFTRDGYRCQLIVSVLRDSTGRITQVIRCGRDWTAEYAGYLLRTRQMAGTGRDRKKEAPPIQLGHIVPFARNGVYGLNYQPAQRRVAENWNKGQTALDLRGIGYSDAEIASTLDIDRYDANYDESNLQCQCATCNRSLEDTAPPVDVALLELARNRTRR